MPLRSIHTCYLLGVNYGVNHLLNNGLYCTKWVHSNLLFGQLLHGLKSSIMGCVPIFTTHPKSCGKVMFLHLSHSVHKGVGVYDVNSCLTAWFFGGGGSAYWESLAPPYGHLVAATKVGGTHPTGIHSFCDLVD